MNNYDLDRLNGADIFDQNNDKIGSIGSVYLDDQTNQPTFATVKTGLFGLKESFIPIDQMTQTGEGFQVPFTKDIVKDAPNIDADGRLDPAEERKIYEYYQRDYTPLGSPDVDHSRDADTDFDIVDDPDRPGMGPGTPGADTDFDVVRDPDRPGATPGTPGADTDFDIVDDPDRADTTLGRYANESGHLPNSNVEQGQSAVAHEERLKVGTETHDAGRVRLRKHVVEDTQTIDVPVEREELVVEREAIDPNSPEARTGAIGGDSEETVTLREERPVVDKETVATERVNVGKQTVQDTETVSADVRREEIDIDRDGIDLDRDGVDREKY